MTPAPTGRPSGRGFWPLRDLPVVGWLVLVVVSALAHPCCLPRGGC